MPIAGYRYKLFYCPKCGQLVSELWYTRHLGSGCKKYKTLQETIKRQQRRAAQAEREERLANAVDININLTITLAGAPPAVVEYVKHSLKGDVHTWGNYGEFDTLNNALAEWLYHRLTPDYNDMPEFHDSEFDLAVKVEPLSRETK